MERNEVDRDLEEKVKKRLIEISTVGYILEQELVMGSREWLESEDINDDPLWQN